MAQTVQMGFTGNQSQFKVYYYGGQTGANSTTAIEAPKDASGNIDLDLTGKVRQTGSTQTDLQLVIRATTGSTLDFTNLLTTPEWSGHFWEGRNNSAVPGGVEFRLSGPLRWADGSPTPTTRYVTAVPSRPTRARP